MEKIIAFILALSMMLSGQGWYHTEGNQIKDEAGNVVMLRGVNTYVCLQNEQAKFDKIAEMGANVVRLNFWKPAVEGVYSQACVANSGLEGIDRAIVYAQNAGLKVILAQMIWANGQNWPTAAFFTDTAMQDGWINMWKVVINRYKDNPNVIGYDLFNEPWAIPNRPANAQVLWEGIAHRAYTELYPLNPNALIFISSWGMATQPAWTLSDVSFLQQPNVVISDHVYGQKTYAFLETRYRFFLDKGIPVWLGEIGFLPSDESFMLNQMHNFDALKLHYTLFAYGIAQWYSDYDMVDASYKLTNIGQIYSDRLIGLQPTQTPLPTATEIPATSTYTPTNTATFTPTMTNTPTSTFTPTNTSTPTFTPTPTRTPECYSIMFIDGTIVDVCKR